MGVVHDPWKKESLVPLRPEILDGSWEAIVAALKELNWSGFRVPLEQAEVIIARYRTECGEPFNWIELDVILSALALARHPEAPDLIERVIAMDDFDFTGVACRALLAWHGLPEVYLIWTGELDCRGFAKMPSPAQDYIRAVDLSGTWNRAGISCYFEDSAPEEIKAMSECFRRMQMADAADALDEAAKLWQVAEAVHELKLTGDAHYAVFDPVHAKWVAAAARMNDGRNSFLEGITRYAVEHANDLRKALGWTSGSIWMPKASAG